MTRINLIYYRGNKKDKNISLTVDSIKSKLDELYKDSEFGYNISNNCNTNFADCHLGRVVDAPYRYFVGDDWFVVNSPIHLFLIHRYFYHKMKHYGREDNMKEFLSFYTTDEKFFSDKLKCVDDSIIVKDDLKLTKLVYDDNLALQIMVHNLKHEDGLILNEGEDGAIMESSYREALYELGIVLSSKEIF